MKERTSGIRVHDNISTINEAVIIINREAIIKFFNPAAEHLFKRNAKDVIGSPFSILWDEFPYERLEESPIFFQEVACKISNKPKILFIFKGVCSYDNDNEHYMVLLREIINVKWFEKQMQQKGYVHAIGHLSAGIAHEIRNPLNTISTIIQQLVKDFEPRNNREEYCKLADLMYREIHRINRTIEDILRFSQPRVMNPTVFQLSDFNNHLLKHYHSIPAQGKCSLSIHTSWYGEVLWDYHQMLQVFMNLIENALDALGKKGKIIITISSNNEEELEVCVHDTGPGIPKEIRSKIFDLFFTTKADRTGIGLYIVQLIIYEHGGVISLKDDERGATFIIRIPKKIEIHRKGPFS